MFFEIVLNLKIKINEDIKELCISFHNSKSLQLGDNLKSCQCIAADLKKEKKADHADNS